MTEQEKIVDKIRKLLALSKSDNQHEAELAAKRANDLMTKHQIEMSEIDIERMQKSGITEERYKVKNQKMKLKWVEYLAQGVAQLFDCTILVNNNLHGTSFTFVGHAEDIETSKLLFEHLYTSWFSIVDHDLKKAKEEFYWKTWKPKDTMKFKAGHGLAFAVAIYWRCDSLKKEREQEVSKKSTGKELVVMKKDALEEYGREQRWGAAKKAKVSAGSSLGQGYGQKAGESIPLGGAIEQ